MIIAGEKYSTTISQLAGGEVFELCDRFFIKEHGTERGISLNDGVPYLFADDEEVYYYPKARMVLS